MTVAFVRIITEPPGIRTIKTADGQISIQFIEAIVRVGEREERHVVVNSCPSALDSATRDSVAGAMAVQVGSQTVSFLQEDRPGYARVVTAGEQVLSAIGATAAVACYMACWGWDESPSIVVNVNGRSVTMVVGPGTEDGWSQLLGSEAPETNPSPK